VDNKRGNPVEEVLPEPVALDLFLQVFACGRDNPAARFGYAMTPDRAEFPVLQDPEQVRLERQGEVTYLIEEKGAFFGRFEQPYFVLDRAGKRPFLMAEQFRFDQGFNVTRAIRSDKRVRRPAAQAVKGARTTSFPVPVSPVIVTTR